jgi:predicted transcriptional regulator
MDIKAEARRLIDQLPDDATWDDLMYEIYVRQAIDAGLADVEAGRVIPHEEVRSRLGLGKKRSA